MQTNYSAIICEGAAEQAIIEILLENNCIIIDNDEYLINEGPIRERSAKSFCDNFMGKNYGSKIDLYRIIDSRNEAFNLDSYEKFDRSSYSKPSEYCKQELKLKQVKSYDYVKNYFSDVDRLLYAIKEVHRIKKSSIPNDSRTLYDLLKDEFK